MHTQSKRFSVLFLALCCVVILMSFLAVRSRAVSETSTVSHHSGAVHAGSSAPHRTVSVGTTLSTYRQHSNAISAVAWSPDGKELASASYDKTVQVWDPVTGQRFTTYRGHSNWITAVAWSPDGKELASASYDKTVQIWEAATGKHLLTYHGHSDTVTAIAWSPDGSHLASASFDNTVQVPTAHASPPAMTTASCASGKPLWPARAHLTKKDNLSFKVEI
jgi:WD40 repeat protein